MFKSGWLYAVEKLSKQTCLHKKWESDIDRHEASICRVVWTGLLLQETNVLGFKGPRKMTILIPGMNLDQERIELKPRAVSSASLITGAIGLSSITELAVMSQQVVEGRGCMYKKASLPSSIWSYLRLHTELITSLQFLSSPFHTRFDAHILAV